MISRLLINKLSSEPGDLYNDPTNNLALLPGLTLIRLQLSLSKITRHSFGQFGQVHIVSFRLYRSQFHLQIDLYPFI